MFSYYEFLTAIRLNINLIKIPCFYVPHLIDNIILGIFLFPSILDRSKIAFYCRNLLGPDAIYVTILRHPVDLFESLYAYANFQTVMKLSIHEYIKR